MAAHSVLLANRHFQDINPIQAGWERCAPGHAFGPAVRSHVLLHYVVSGRGVFLSGGRRYPVGPGQVFVIRPFETTTYAASEDQPWQYIWLGFEANVPLPAALGRDVLTLPQAGPLFSCVPGVPELPAGREAFLCGKIWELLSLLAGEEAPGAEVRRKQAQDYVNIAKTYLETEYSRGVSVAELARRLNLDRSYFSKLFRRETGRSPQQYLTEFRLQKAAELLRDHGKTPGEAALSTGYPDVFSFSRMFKRYFGVPPTAYREGRPSDARPAPPR